MKEDKPIVTIAGKGTVDECDSCGAVGELGAAVYNVKTWEQLNLCNKCLSKKYIIEE